MLKDIFIIILIVVLSYVFTIRQNNKDRIFNPQLMFILLALSVIVAYKVIYFKKLSKFEEGFNTDVGSEIINFIEGLGNDNVSDRISTISEADRKKYIDAITNLSGKVDVLHQQMKENADNESPNSNLGTNDTLSLEAIQKMQNFQIDFLQKQIDKSKELLQQQEIEENIKKYKPLKVYSSCTVSSADGSFNEDSLENTRAGQSNLTGGQMQSINNMLNTISQGNISDGASVQQPVQNQNVLAGVLSSLLNSQQSEIHLT